MNLTSLSLLATSAKIRYTMTSNCDRKMSLRNKHLSNGSNLPGTLLQFTTHLSLVTCRPVKHTSVTIVILTNIFTCHDRTFRFMKQGPDPSFSVVLPGVYACVVVCDLETSTIRRARTELSCCATHTHTHTHTQKPKSRVSHSYLALRRSSPVTADILTVLRQFPHPTAGH